MLAPTSTTAVELQAKLFHGFSDPARLSILNVLCSGPCTVSDIVTKTGLSQPNASNHLRCLRDCGLVAVEPRGRFAWYNLSDPRIAQLLLLAEGILSDVAQGVYECTRYSLPER